MRRSWVIDFSVRWDLPHPWEDTRQSRGWTFLILALELTLGLRERTVEDGGYPESRHRNSSSHGWDTNGRPPGHLSFACCWFSSVSFALCKCRLCICGSNQPYIKTVLFCFYQKVLETKCFSSTKPSRHVICPQDSVGPPVLWS